MTAEEDVIADFASQSDEQLMMLYRQGEYGAFEELYFRHSGRVYAYLRSKLTVPGEAEDLLQTSFMKLHQSRESFDATMPFLPWVFAITRNVLIDHIRKHKPVPIAPEKVTALADRKIQQESEVRGEADWEEIMKLLPEDQRNLLALRFEEGLSFDEIAKRCGGNETSVRKRVSRTIQGIRKILSGQRKGVR